MKMKNANMDQSAMECVEHEEHIEDRKRERGCGLGVNDTLSKEEEEEEEEEERILQPQRKTPKTDYDAFEGQQCEKDSEFSMEGFGWANSSEKHSFEAGVDGKDELTTSLQKKEIDLYVREKGIEGVDTVVECNDDECDDGEWGALFGEETADDDDSDGPSEKQESNTREHHSVEESLPLVETPNDDAACTVPVEDPTLDSEKGGEMDQERGCDVMGGKNEKDDELELQSQSIGPEKEDKAQEMEGKHRSASSQLPDGVLEWKTVFDECKLPDGKVDMDASMRKLREMDHAADAEKRKLQYAVDPHDREIVSECIVCPLFFVSYEHAVPSFLH
jgi:hypothetical protein